LSQRIISYEIYISRACSLRVAFWFFFASFAIFAEEVSAKRLMTAKKAKSHKKGAKEAFLAIGPKLGDNT